MRIDFESSGGFANLRLNYHGDTATLPPEQAEELSKLINSSGVFDLKQNEIKSAAGGPPDVVSYHLSLAGEGKEKTLSFNDVTAPASLRPLLAHLRKLALEQKRKGA